jgi:formylmethanofuran dehydrogenase subunit E
MTNSNRSLGRCIRCEAMTRSYIGVKVRGKVLCKHCAGAQGYNEPMEEAIGDGPV